MVDLKEKRIDWLYQHFQAISKASKSYLYLIGVVLIVSVNAFYGQEHILMIPGLNVPVTREIVLASCGLAGSFLVVAYCGNFDKGEHTVKRLAAALGCKYEDLVFVDPHPNIFDFAKYARDTVCTSRGYIARLLVAMLYSLVLTLSLFWFVFVASYQLFMFAVTGPALVLYLAALPVTYISADRVVRFSSRRWLTFWANERQRSD